jgi:hypothetical protein
MAILELRHRAERLRRRVLLPILIVTPVGGFAFSLAVGFVGLVPFLIGAVPVGFVGALAYRLARRQMRRTWLDEWSGKRGLSRAELARHATRFA